MTKTELEAKLSTLEKEYSDLQAETRVKTQIAQKAAQELRELAYKGPAYRAQIKEVREQLAALPKEEPKAAIVAE